MEIRLYLVFQQKLARHPVLFQHISVREFSTERNQIDDYAKDDVEELFAKVHFVRIRNL